MWLITYERKSDDSSEKETVETELNPKKYLDNLYVDDQLDYGTSEFYILFAIELKD